MNQYKKCSIDDCVNYIMDDEELCSVHSRKIVKPSVKELVQYKRRLKWQRNYLSSDWLYEKNDDNTARFVLGVKGTNPLICFGVNPSIATPEEPDDTLCRLEKLAYKKEYDSWIMLNLYPLRKTNIKELTFNKELHNENLKRICNLISDKSYNVLAAWGNIFDKVPKYIRDDIIRCSKDICELAKYKCKFVALKIIEEPNRFPVHLLYREKGFSLYETKFVEF